MISHDKSDILAAHSAAHQSLSSSAHPTRTLRRSGSTTKRLASPPHGSQGYETLSGPPGSKRIEGRSGGQLVSLPGEKELYLPRCCPPPASKPGGLGAWQ